MKRMMLITALGSACIGLAACDSAQETTTETTEPANDDTAYDSSSGTAAAPANTGAVDSNGTRLSVGPGGAELRVDGDDADVSVDSEGPALEVDTRPND